MFRKWNQIAKMPHIIIKKAVKKILVKLQYEDILVSERRGKKKEKKQLENKSCVKTSN